VVLAETDLREIDEATREMTVHGDRYAEGAQRWIDR
jgi:hypothetical protein